MSKNEVKKEKKRNDLLKAAYELFTTVGFSKTTILSISLRAGVGKGTFYLYFDSKEDVRDTLIMQKSSEILLKAMNELDHTVQNSEEVLSVTDKVIFITDYIINYMAKDITMLKFISKHLSWGMFSESSIIGKGDKDILDFRNFVTEIMERDGIRIEQPDLLIYTVIELINSTIYNVILHGEPVTFSDYKPYLYKTIRLIVNDAVMTEQ